MVRGGKNNKKKALRLCEGDSSLLEKAHSTAEGAGVFKEKVGWAAAAKVGLSIMVATALAAAFKGYFD